MDDLYVEVRIHFDNGSYTFSIVVYLEKTSVKHLEYNFVLIYQTLSHFHRPPPSRAGS